MALWASRWICFSNRARAESREPAKEDKEIMKEQEKKGLRFDVKVED